MEGLQQAVLAQLSLESLLLRRAEGREGVLDLITTAGPRIFLSAKLRGNPQISKPSKG